MKWGKTALIIICAVVLTSFGIDAADTLVGEKGTLLSQAIRSNEDGCPRGMVGVSNIPTLTCADRFEATTGDTCAVPNPQNILDSNRNIEDDDCVPESTEGSTPWRFITRDQAMQACARAGKRLPTSAEWYALSLGISHPEASCNVDSSGLSSGGEYGECVAPSGAYDLVGNVWEWVHDDVIDGNYNGRALPQTGYVAQVDAGGMATVSTSTEADEYGSDYFWSDAEGAYGIIRGGFYNSERDAGIYAVHADTPPNTAGTAIGFRCVK